MNEDRNLIVTDEFRERVRAFNKDFWDKYKKISKEKTPDVDGTGRKIVDKRPDGFDYIIEAYMRECLDKHFPGWSWEAAAPMTTVLNYLLAQGHLIIYEPYLIAFGINPPVRKFYGVGAARIQFKRGAPLTPENVVDIDKNAKSADSAALKYAINRLTHIGDDVYGKRIEEEGAGTIEDLFQAEPDATNFAKLVQDLKVKGGWNRVWEILGVKSIRDISNYKDAYNKIKEIINE